MLKDLINNQNNEHSHFGAVVYSVKNIIAKSKTDENFKLRHAAALLIKSGRFKFRFGESIIDLKSHDLIILPEDLDCNEEESEGKLHFFLVVFSRTTVRKEVSRNTTSRSFPLHKNRAVKISLETSDYKVLSLICRLLYTQGHHQRSSDFELELQRLSSDLLFFELRHIYSKYIDSSGLYTSKAEGIALQFLTVLSIHCKKHHNVKFYAGVLYVAPEYLNRAVRQALGKTAKVIITEAVLIEAVQLLEDPTYSIAEIAEELEFSTGTAFGIFFKKWMHCTPSEYRSNAIERFKGR